MNIIRLNSIGEPFAKSGQATPPSGGGTEEWEYIDLSNADSTTISVLSRLAFLYKCAAGDDKVIIPTTQGTVVAVGYIPSTMVTNTMTSTIETLGEYINYTANAMGIDVASLPRLTEEQFYTL